MKKWAFIFVFAIFFIGCARQSESLSLPNYISKDLGIRSNSSIVINSIIDKRKNKSIVATITDKEGGTKEFITLGDDLDKWFANALKKELKANGAHLEDIGHLSQNTKVVDISILDLRANLSGFAQDNMQGNIEVYIRIHQNVITTTKRLSQAQSKFVVLPTRAAFEPFIADMVNDMVSRSAKVILAN